MSNTELTEEERRRAREDIEMINIRVNAYLNKAFGKYHQWQVINLETGKFITLQTKIDNIGFDENQCYTVPILKTDKKMKTIADDLAQDESIDGKGLIYPIDEEALGLIDMSKTKDLKGIGRPIDDIPEPKTTKLFNDETGQYDIVLKSSLKTTANEKLGHRYTTCQNGCINRLKYCGCAIMCMCCEKHLTDCKDEYCKNCRVTGEHLHEDGSAIGRY